MTGAYFPAKTALATGGLDRLALAGRALHLPGLLVVEGVADVLFGQQLGAVGTAVPAEHAVPVLRLGSLSWPC